MKVAFAAAYSRVSDENLALIPNSAVVASIDRVQSDKDVGYFQIGGYIQHVPTGLFLYAAYGKENGDVVYSGNTLLPTRYDADGDHWYVKAGLRRKWHALGHTVMYGEYGQMNDMLSPTIGLPGDSSELTKWGLGVVQEIDAAAMSLWLSYRNYDGEHTSPAGVVLNEVDAQYIKAGALINF